MNVSWKILLKAPILYTFSVIGMFSLFVIKMNILPPQIPLYYSHAINDQQIVQTYYISLLPLLVLICLVLNTFFVSKILNNDFSRKVAHTQNIFLIVMVFYIFVKIITLVS